jgi:hypothetical protein
LVLVLELAASIIQVKPAHVVDVTFKST